MIRRRQSLLFLSCAMLGASASCGAQADVGEAEVVRDAVEAISACYHWAGEVGDQSEARNREIAEGMRRDCPLAQQKAANAYRAHPGNTRLAAALLQLIDIDSFPLGEKEKARVCETAVRHFTADFRASRTEDVVFRAICPVQAKRVYGS